MNATVQEKQNTLGELRSPSDWVDAHGDFLFNLARTPRYTAAEIQEIVAPLKKGIAELEAQLKARNEA